MTEYSVLTHGDALEKEASKFIELKFPSYEKVWKVYVGHNGKGIMADIPNYPDPGKRKKFAQHARRVCSKWTKLVYAISKCKNRVSTSTVFKYCICSRNFAR